MNYQRVYSNLVSYRQSNIPSGYSEKHHIIPRALGGGDAKSNLVRLTGREHFIAHRLLAKIYGGKMWLAVALMSQRKAKSSKDHKCTSREYEYAKKKAADWVSEAYSGEGNPFHGKKHGMATRIKISANHARLSGADNPCFGRSHTDDERERMRGPRPSIKGHKHHLYGIDRGDDFKWLVSMVRSYKPNPVVVKLDVLNQIHATLGIEIGISNNGTRQSKSKEIAKLNQYFGSMSKARPKTECPHCGKVGDASGMKRWHFDNCTMRF